MKQRLFVLYGRGSIGKTCTIKRACEAFAMIDGASLSVLDSGREDDIVCVVTINRKKVGFSSGGDSPEDVERGLKKLKGCEVVVCAASAYTGATHYIYEYIDKTDHQLYWIRQPILDAYYEKGHAGTASKVDLGCYYTKRNQVVVDLILKLLKRELDL